MIHVFKKGDSLDTLFIYEGKDMLLTDNGDTQGCDYIQCINEEDLFLTLLNLFPREPFWSICEIINKFEISATRNFLIKSYCSKSNRVSHYNGEDLFLLLETSGHNKYVDIYAVCTPYEYRNFKHKDSYHAIKIRKATLPFYLSLFMNRFTAKDFYFCLKNITRIRHIPVINTSLSEFYIVVDKSRIISYHTSEDTALRTSNIIKEIKSDNKNSTIIKVDDYEKLLDIIDKYKIQKSSDFEKYMIDYEWYFDYCFSGKSIDVSCLSLENDVFLVRDKDGSTIAKDSAQEMFEYIKNNKLYSEDIFFLKKNDYSYNTVTKVFNKIKEEFLHDTEVSTHLESISYLEKMTLLNTLLDLIGESNCKNRLLYSYTKSDDSVCEISFFNDICNFHKYTTSLDYNIHSLSHGELDISDIRRIVSPITRQKNNQNNTIVSRADVALNISNLFRNKETHNEYLRSLKEMDYIVDVDSYLKHNKSSCGVVVRDQSGEVTTKLAKRLDAKTSVEAEIKGAMSALQYALLIEPESTNICLRYDCFSVADYLISEPTSDIGKEYQEFVRNLIHDNPNTNIYIKKVRGHSSDFFNDIAHSLAGNFFNQ